MRIGLLTWAYPPEKSGLSRAAREIAESLVEARQDVRVLTLDRGGRETMAGVEVIGCAPSARATRARGLAAIGHLVAPALFARAVRREHRRRAFDIVEATNWYAPGLLVALAGPVPLVVRNSTPVAETMAARGPRDRIDRAAAMLAERHAARGAAGLISNTAAHGSKIAALYGVREPGEGHAVIGLSLPAAIVARGAASPTPNGGTPRLLFVGRPERRKGFSELTDALALLADEDVPFEALLIGVTENDVAQLPAAARARIETRHRVPEPALHDALAAAHVVLAPSRYESFGIVYQEAMAFGRPILACAEDPSARLFVGETGAGVLAPRCEARAIADTLRPLLVDPARRAALADASRRAAGRFTRATLAAETIAAYAAALGGPR